MTIQKQLHPDAPGTAGTTAPSSKPAKKRYTPGAFTDLEAVAKQVNTTWAAIPAITLLWTTQAQFADLVKSFSTTLSSQNTAQGNMPSQTQTLRQLDTDMNARVNDVKGGILNKFKKGNEVAQYARYGIVKEGSMYKLPSDRDKRLKNLDLMIAAIHADGFDNETWGATFWTDMKTKYANAIEASGSNDGKVSTGSGSLVTMAKQIDKTFTALRFVLRGNYPDTYKTVYRDWGWQKENY